MASGKQRSSQQNPSLQDALKQAGERFRLIAENAYDMIVEIDDQGRVKYASPNHTEGSQNFSGTENELLSLEAVHPEDRPQVTQAFATAFRNGENQRLTFRVGHSNSLRWIECTITPIGDEANGRRVLIVSRDITGLKTVESRLRDSRERFRLIAENAYDMIAEFEPSGRVRYVNEQAQHILGAHDTRDWRSAPNVLVHPDDLARVAKAFASALAGDDAATAMHRIQHADGSWRWIEARYRSATTESGEQRVVLIARDRTHDVEAERRLVESEVRYRELVETSPLGIIVLQNQRVAFANAACAEICGAENPEELRGTPLKDFFDSGDTNSLQQIRNAQRANPSEEALLEIRIRGIDGQIRHVLATGNQIEFEGRPAYQGLLRDISGLRRAEEERKRLELQLQEARKLESLGILAGGIAHDFNNLLAIILANTRFSLQPEAGDAERTEALEETIQAGERAARLTKQLLAYAGRRTPDVRSIDLGDLVQATSDLLRTAIPNHVDLNVSLDASAPHVRGDVVQIEQVLMNLVINAADSIGDVAGSVEVSTGVTEIHGDETTSFAAGTALSRGRYAFLEVADTGRGIDTRTQARIFEPFFSTKSEGHGLGLAAVIGLVKGHDGAIELESKIGVGTRFRVLLPASLESDSPATRDSDGEAILFVGPLADLRADPAWERWNRTEINAVDDSAALAMLELHGSEVALVVCDEDALENPTQFHEDLRLRWPNLPVLRESTFDASPGIAADALQDLPVGRRLADTLEVLLGKP